MSYYQGELVRFLHPTMQMIDSGRQMWLWYNGVAARIRYTTGSGISAVVSDAKDLIWIDEAGLLDNAIVDAVRPCLWERQGDLVCTGTPSLGLEHFFSRGILSGLDPSHEYYQAHIVERDPDALAVIGTSYEAALPAVREQAAQDAQRLGSAWTSQWVLGDWRLPDVFVFSKFSKQIHVIDYDINRHKIGGIQLPPPHIIIGVMDFSYSDHTPGAAVVYHVWPVNPLDPTDRTRPLVVAVRDRQECLRYDQSGWIRVFEELRIDTSLRVWYADPSSADLLKVIRKNSAKIGYVKEADKHDKMGRLGIVASWLEHNETQRPSMYVDRSCANVIRQLENYRWKLDRDKNPTGKPMEHDDHCIDCTAFLAGVITSGGSAIPSLRF
jgi:hypothetical protein